MNDEIFKAKEKALSLLNYRMRTEKELKDKLLDADFSEEAAFEAIEYVRSYGYLNDRAYAEQYVSSRSSMKGDYLLKRELREKGVSEEIISEVFEESETDTGKVIYELIEKKCGAPHVLEDKEYRRTFSFLARRGFEAHDIYIGLKAYSESETFD